jgi:hypothetical protein
MEKADSKRKNSNKEKVKVKEVVTQPEINYA